MNMLGYLESLQQSIINKKNSLRLERERLVKELKAQRGDEELFNYTVSFTNAEQVVDFIEFCKSVKGKFYTTSLDSVSKAAFSDQLFFTDTIVKEPKA